MESSRKHGFYSHKPVLEAKKCQESVKTDNIENFSNIQERVLETNRLLKAVQVQALQSPSTHLIEEERQLNQKWLFPQANRGMPL